MRNFKIKGKMMIIHNVTHDVNMLLKNNDKQYEMVNKKWLVTIWRKRFTWKKLKFASFNNFPTFYSNDDS